MEQFHASVAHIGGSFSCGTTPSGFLMSSSPSPTTLLPNKPRGILRVDDRRVISGFIHVIRHGLMWRDAPLRYGPYKTLYNRFVRWSQIGVFDHIFSTLASESTASPTVMIDANHLKAHRTAASLLIKGLFPDASDVPAAV